jgi:transposase
MVNVGIDLHKTQFTVCVRGKNGDKFEQYETDAEGYEQFLKRVRVWQKAGQEVRIGVESTGNTRYFKNQMEEAGVTVKVINTLKFKVVNESVNKTDRHDASTIAYFLEKDMLPESKLCSQSSEQLRRLLKVRTVLVRTTVTVKNQIHALLTALGMKDVKASLQSKKGRKEALDALNKAGNGLVVQPLFEIIDRQEESVKDLEEELERLVEGDRIVALLKTIPGCGKICAWTIRAYTDDIGRFTNAKKYAAYAGLVPWVQNSNETIHIGKITKRGPEELRTALVQVVMGIRRCKKTTVSWRIMQQYDVMKRNKGSGKSIIATARKLATIIWHMLSGDAEFDVSLMTDRKLTKKAAAMQEASTGTPGCTIAKKALEEEKPLPKNAGVKHHAVTGSKKETDVVGKKRKKVG